MKLYSSTGASFIHNHPVINIVHSTPVYPKFSPETKKLVIEKRQKTNKSN